jgi:hypothetical protein
MQDRLLLATIDEPTDATATFTYPTRANIPPVFTCLSCTTVPAGCSVAATKLGGLLDARSHTPTITSLTASGGNGAEHVAPLAVPLVHEVEDLK